jgi:hypothetical protein
MKLALAALVAIAAVEGNPLRFLQSTQCQDCFEQIDDAQDCLRECNDVSYYNYEAQTFDGTVLNECLDPDRQDRDFNEFDTQEEEDLRSDLEDIVNSDDKSIRLIRCVDGDENDREYDECEDVINSAQIDTTVSDSDLVANYDEELCCFFPEKSERQAQVNDIEELSDCCSDGLSRANVRWNDRCEDIFDEVAQCLVDNCFGLCLVRDANAWFQCIQDRTDDITGDKGCSRQVCINGLFDEEEGDSPAGDGNDIDFTVQENLEDQKDSFIEIGNSKDSIFDLENVGALFEGIANTISDCSVLDTFTESVCRVGDQCCEDCNTEMATVMDCLLNQVVAPFVAIAANVSGPLICPVPTDCVISRRDRFLNAMEGQEGQVSAGGRVAVDYTLGMPKMVRMFEERRRLQNTTEVDDAQFCVDQMAMNTVAHNMTYAANKFMECTASAGLAQLQDPPTVPADGASVASLIVTMMLSAVSAMAVLF